MDSLLVIDRSTSEKATSSLLRSFYLTYKVIRVLHKKRSEKNRDASSPSSSSRECLHGDCSVKSITASTIPVHCSASSSLFARHSARSRGSRNPRYSAIFLLEFTIYRIYQRVLFVSSRSPPLSLETHGPRYLLLHI